MGIIFFAVYGLRSFLYYGEWGYLLGVYMVGFGAISSFTYFLVLVLPVLRPIYILVLATAMHYLYSIAVRPPWQPSAEKITII
ncbi:hypothetical protein BJ508DRAFT_81179 [Ascobolus immersus RN42]|uniref:Uncharacterized protein n=1 Tax=Ascobolus immersus RN42 TaxID=1160509 RepID=A0A3N4IBR0_ASCIM|nr:hypothetical protein BJ508DRAFT_81179 [Ascobolus immersus RN42]